MRVNNSSYSMKKTIFVNDNIAADWAEIEEAAKAYGQDIGVSVGVAVYIVNVLWKSYKGKTK